jgi:hypothetical protein
VLRKVISGGQTGVDAAALRAAAQCGIPTGGWCPRGWRTEQGPAPWLADFGLEEMPTPSYKARTRKNIKNSDATMILAMTEPLSGGTALTQTVCLETGKPFWFVDLTRRDTLVQQGQEVLTWIATKHVQSLNVAGPRESECPGIGQHAEAFLVTVFQRAC